MSFDIAKLRRPDWVSEDVLIFQYDEILTAMHNGEEFEGAYFISNVSYVSYSNHILNCVNVSYTTNYLYIHLHFNYCC